MLRQSNLQGCQTQKNSYLNLFYFRHYLSNIMDAYGFVFSTVCLFPDQLTSPIMFLTKEFRFFPVYLIQQEWTLGRPLCDTWLSVDYLSSNASVMNLLVISFDRYFSVTRYVNFTKVLCAAFTLVDPKSVKNTVKSSVSFYAFGICERKAVRRTLMKLSPGLSI